MTTDKRHTKTRLRMGLVPRAKAPAARPGRSPSRAAAARAKVSREEEQLLFEGLLAPPPPAKGQKPKGRK